MAIVYKTHDTRLEPNAAIKSYCRPGDIVINFHCALKGMRKRWRVPVTHHKTKFTVKYPGVFRLKNPAGSHIDRYGFIL